MPRLLVIGDVHDHRERLDATLELVDGQSFDLVLQTGDVGADPPWHSPARNMHRGSHDASVAGVLQRIRSAIDAPLLFVPGNHDLDDPPSCTHAKNVDGAVMEAAGLRVAGLGGAGPARFGFPYEWSEEDADRRLGDSLRDDGCRADILLAHTPPAQSGLDRTAHGAHVGSVAIGRWIERAAPRLFVCGHIHEAAGVERRHETLCLNAGSLGEPYGQVLAWVVEWTNRPAKIHRLTPEGSHVTEG